MKNNPDVHIRGDVVTALRDAPGVLHAYGCGVVSCMMCDGVHIDFIDERMNIIASALVNFVQWDEMVAQIAEERKPQ